MYMKKILFHWFFMFSVALIAQENQTDENGEKDGHWLVKYPNGKTYYDVNFAHGIPVGTEKRYDEKGQLKVSMNHSGDGKSAAVYMYRADGIIHAMGKYLDQKRDSIWRYYFDDSLVMKEMGYKAGVQHGKWISYYRNGQVFEHKEFDNGIQVGEFKQFFKNGQMKLEVKIKDGKWAGTMKNYYPNGNPANIGLYTNGMKQGKWVFYDEKGKVTKKIHFRNSEVTCSTEDQISYYDLPTVVGEPSESYDEYGMMNNEDVEVPVQIKRTVIHWDTACYANFTAYYPDEKLKRTGFYVDNSKDSIWTYYNQNGNKDSLITYTMNVKDGETILYHPNGEVSVKQYYKKGTLHGIKELYSASGKLLRRDEYVNGVVKQMNE